MLITCPSCSATYDVPDAVVRNGRKVRCARCRTEWGVARQPELAETRAAPARPAPAMTSAHAFGMSEEEEGEELHFPQLGPAPPVQPEASLDDGQRVPPLPHEVTPAAIRRSRGPDGETEWDRRERTTRLLVGLGWLGTAVVLLLLVWAGYHFRSGIVQAWPASERLYAALGWRLTN